MFNVVRTHFPRQLILTAIWRQCYPFDEFPKYPVNAVNTELGTCAHYVLYGAGAIWRT